MVPLVPGLGLTFLGKRSPTVETRRFEPDFLKIRCPLCQWQPQKTDRWLCSPGCHHCWNTFETAGVCPGCAKHWHDTACLRCQQWSPHEDWYEGSDLP
jgi:hypothetical protein